MKTPGKDHKNINPDELASVEGAVDHYIFQNELNGFSVAVFQEEGKRKRDQFTVVGPMTGISPGETVRLYGEWVINPKFGRQFEVKSFVPILPATVTGIKRYLGSGLIKGIGPKFASRIVKHFKDKTLDIIEEDPDRLREVPNIGPKRLGIIKEAWQEHSLIRDIMVFLQSHNISLNLSTKIYRRYGADSIRVLREDPYQTALDIHGVGFKRADVIASSMGIEKDAPQRIRAGVIHVLNEASSSEGHTFLYKPQILAEAKKLLEVEEERIEEAIDHLVKEELIISEEFPEGRALFPKALHVCEKNLSQRLMTICPPREKPFRSDAGKALSEFEKKFRFELAERQRDAILHAMKGGVMVITGGPGTGKTTIVRAIIYLLSMTGIRIKLCAPTGRAAKRLEETTSMEATTIHRLLKFQPRSGGFSYNEINPIPADLLIVDETSMLDVVLAYHLVKALPRKASVIFVGDADQLPPVGPGNFLRDIMDSGRAAVIRLSEIFRQARRSLIVVNAHRINQGQMPYSPKPDRKPRPDYYFIQKPEPEEALDAMRRLISERIPEKFRMDPTKDVQVITPMYRGLLGANNLNSNLQNLLNPNPDYITRGSLTLRIGDKVMQIRNNYDKDVYNGDLGIVVNFDREYQMVRVNFDGRIVPYEYKELDDLVLAYAITVHKSQGSEYPAVIIPVMTQHFIMLQRNLLYTAVTRGKRLVCIVGTKKALAIAVKNARKDERNSALDRWLREGMKKEMQEEMPF